MRHVTCIMRERQLRQFGHVVRFPETDPVRRILLADDPAGARRPRGRPRLTWLRQIERYFREMGMGRVSARRIAEGNPEAYRRKVNAATCCHGTCSHT